MKRMQFFLAAAAVVLIGPAASAQNAAAPAAPQQPMGFFVTGETHSGDLGGLEGADAICQRLASAVGSGNRTWRAYLSTQAAANTPAENARDRIGKGPWHNVKGQLIAKDVADLHGDVERDRNNIAKETALTETGAMVAWRGGEKPSEHDMLTGSDSHGRALPAGEDKTCRNWTYAGKDGAAMIGHHDRASMFNTSWNSSHMTQGCSLENLNATGGAGRFYCFAAD